MLGDIILEVFSSLIKSKMPADQKVRLSFDPPEGKIIIKLLHHKNKKIVKNDTYELSFKQLKTVFDKT